MADNDDDRDGRNPITRGYILGARVTSIGIQMALPPAIGWWADGKFKTEPWLFILGTVIGFAIAMLDLVRLAKDSENH